MKKSNTHPIHRKPVRLGKAAGAPGRSSCRRSGCGLRPDSSGVLADNCRDFLTPKPTKAHLDVERLVTYLGGSSGSLRLAADPSWAVYHIFCALL